MTRAIGLGTNLRPNPQLQRTPSPPPSRQRFGKKYMKLPSIRGVIRRRILVNFRVQPEVIQAQIPSRFRPKLHAGSAIAGICLIRLEAIRPRFVPSVLGVRNENAAHRIAVLWDDDTGVKREGVFIPGRDTGSVLNELAGGRVFPVRTSPGKLSSSLVRWAYRSRHGFSRR
jgi:uncharacterized protein DUF2071